MSNKKEDYKYEADYGLKNPPDIDISKLVQCSFSYSFDPLKEAIEYLLKTQSQTAASKRLTDLEARLKDYEKMADELKHFK